MKTLINNINTSDPFQPQRLVVNKMWTVLNKMQTALDNPQTTSIRKIHMSNKWFEWHQQWHCILFRVHRPCLTLPVVYTPPWIRASPMESTASLHRLSTVHGLRMESVQSPSRNPLSMDLRRLHGLCCLIECTKIEHNQDWTRDLQIVMWCCQHN